MKVCLLQILSHVSLCGCWMVSAQLLTGKEQYCQLINLFYGFIWNYFKYFNNSNKVLKSWLNIHIHFFTFLVALPPNSFALMVFLASSVMFVLCCCLLANRSCLVSFNWLVVLTRNTMPLIKAFMQAEFPIDWMTYFV